MMGKVKAIPEGYTIYDKIVIDGPMSFDQLFAKLRADYNIDITLVSSGKVALYNGYLPGNKHGVRRPRNMEDVYREIAEDPIPEGRSYLAIEVGGEELTEGCDFVIPTIKYYFQPRQ